MGLNNVITWNAFISKRLYLISIIYICWWLVSTLSKVKNFYYVLIGLILEMRKRYCHKIFGKEEFELKGGREYKFWYNCWNSIPAIIIFRVDESCELLNSGNGVLSIDGIQAESNDSYKSFGTYCEQEARKICEFVGTRRIIIMKLIF